MEKIEIECYDRFHRGSSINPQECVEVRGR